jgi:hypothetical protein
MNFKERGITIGDLLILLIVILTTTVLVKTFKKDTKTSFYLSKEQMGFYKTMFSKDDGLIKNLSYNFNSKIYF